ncbi:class GN sortase [Shewanella sp. Scap07]|uniref:class GN sortase n=1 Tax=Shewanella sp. Scap07 TaxID=2589987 RepID=UPI0015BEF8BC|nr:class GN sortase [Shewanella sp. Scap07]QLE85370.1 class GN sortase [Shewanella sp. Scap07]
MNKSANFTATLKLKICVLGLVLGGVALIFSGGYMQAKAHFAQFLIENAWQKTLNDSQFHKPWSWADTYPVAKLRFERQQGDRNDLYVLAGASGRNLAFGPAAMLVDNEINVWGNTVIAGHRDSHFSLLKYVKPGDTIAVEDANADEMTYRVVNTQIVHQSQIEFSDNDEVMLTLVTCYPFDSISPNTEYRLVVTALPVSSNRHYPISA